MLVAQVTVRHVDLLIATVRGKDGKILRDTYALLKESGS